MARFENCLAAKNKSGNERERADKRGGKDAHTPNPGQGFMRLSRCQGRPGPMATRRKSTRNEGRRTSKAFKAFPGLSGEVLIFFLRPDQAEDSCYEVQCKAIQFLKKRGMLEYVDLLAVVHYSAAMSRAA